jgi:glucose-1-phosphate thymidylyltransferase
MREPDSAVPLDDRQRRAADAGHKMMMPLNGRPFLEYVLSGRAEAGIAEAALVVAPDHTVVRARYAAQRPARIALSFVVQTDALGTANAILAVEAWTRGEPFLAMNADNLYPVEALRAMVVLQEPGLPAFDRDDLVRSGNVPAARIVAFALIHVDGQGYLREIVEKPVVGSTDGALVSMNLWRFDARIFEACRDVPRSVRGEFELPGAVGLAIARGARFKAIPARGPVLDLSRRADAPDLERRLSGVVPAP